MIKSLLSVSFFAAVIMCTPHSVAEDVSSQSHRELAKDLLAAYVFVASGSGVLISPDGLILSNHHVTDELSPQTVRLAGGQSFEATLLGVDPVGDIALLKIEHDEPLPYVPLATADDYQLGMPVFAVGNPFGLGDRDDIPSLSRGFLSTLRVVRGNYTDTVQVDAPVNPGNSGGPLLSMDGKLLGINGQIRTRSGMRINSGIGLAIAAPQLAEFIPVLAKANGGYAHHGVMPEGIELRNDAGKVVVHKSPDGHALQVGDELLVINNREVTSPDTARGLFEAPVWRKGRTVSVDILRTGDRKTIEVALDRKTIPGKPWHGLSIRIGDIVLPDTETGLREKYKMAQIRKIDKESPAEKAGITQGEWIERIDGKAISSPLTFLRALAQKEIGDRIEIDLISNDGERRSVSVLLRPRN